MKKRLEEIIDFTGDENDYVVFSDLECLKYLHENGCPWNEEVCCYATSGGHFEILNYLHAKGCPRDRNTCSSAARGGRFEILNYLHAKGCPTSEADDEDDQDLEHSIKRQRMIDELGIPNQIVITFDAHTRTIFYSPLQKQKNNSRHNVLRYV